MNFKIKKVALNIGRKGANLIQFTFLHCISRFFQTGRVGEMLSLKIRKQGKNVIPGDFFFGGGGQFAR